MEGRAWMNICREKFNAKIVNKPSQDIGFYYIYANYTTCFIEFTNYIELDSCIRYLNTNSEYWAYDGYCLLKSQPHEHFLECKMK